MERRERTLIEFGLGLIAILLAGATVVVAAGNRAVRAEIAANQAKVARAQTISTVGNTVVQLLARASVENNDQQIRDLLARNGINFQVNQQEAQQAAPPPASNGSTAP